MFYGTSKFNNKVQLCMICIPLPYVFLQIPCQYCKQCNAADFNPFTAALSDAFHNALEKNILSNHPHDIATS